LSEEEPIAELSTKERVEKRIAETSVSEKDVKAPVMTEPDRRNKSRPTNKPAPASDDKSV
jgi:hypothetical protein